jgi:pyridinium-3,5-biscarboxylic acid mononucleotide synthase
MKENLRILLEGVKDGTLGLDAALAELAELPFKDLGFAKVDTHRELRQNYPEAVFCEGKTPEQVRDIVRFLASRTDNILATRASQAAYDAIASVLPDAVYHPLSRMVVVKESGAIVNQGTIVVVTGGTSDLPVAEEAALTARAMGNRVEVISDAGVAGIHRLFASLEQIRRANVVIAVAGMEGALASVIGGLVDRPVVAVPTSIGYGANFHGLAALLSMLNTCSAGVGVVNIDNGFGAGHLASLINEQRSAHP